MTLSPDRNLLGAAAVAMLLHALLFLSVRPVPERAARPVPPATFYAALPQTDAAAVAAQSRTLWSPVMFSLPSGMGFSRELRQRDVSTRLSFSQEVKPEQFLQVDPSSHEDPIRLVSDDLMVTSPGGVTPALPDMVSQDARKKPPAPRVYMAPELKTRLVGGIVLPPVLNQESSAPWEVRASVSVAEGGMVRHVFLERPLEQASLNQQVLQLLYGLRFKSGAPVEGSIELYSPRNGGVPE